MGFVGLALSEYSTGEKRAQGSITKVGNAHACRLLVEAETHPLDVLLHIRNATPPRRADHGLHGTWSHIAMPTLAV
jgi:transposase IS116/IS110/IS902 family protein